MKSEVIPKNRGGVMNFGNSQKSRYFWEQTIDDAAMKSEIIPKNRGGVRIFGNGGKARQNGGRPLTPFPRTGCRGLIASRKSARFGFAGLRPNPSRRAASAAPRSARPHRSEKA